MDRNLWIFDTSAFERKKAKQIIEGIGNFNVIEFYDREHFQTDSNLQKVPVLILMDIALPTDKDGLWVLSRIKESALLKDVPIIILTHLEFHVYYKNLSSTYSVNDFIIKPYKPERLISALKSCIKDPAVEKVIPVKAETPFYNLEHNTHFTLTIEEFFDREIKVASRTNSNLSIILIRQSMLSQKSKSIMKDMDQMSSNLYQIVRNKKLSFLRTTDEVILNSNGDILVILPITNAENVKKVYEKLVRIIRNELEKIGTQYSDYFYSGFATFPEDGNNLHLLMSKAVINIENKKKLEEATVLLENNIKANGLHYKIYKYKK